MDDLELSSSEVDNIDTRKGVQPPLPQKALLQFCSHAEVLWFVDKIDLTSGFSHLFHFDEYCLCSSKLGL